TVTLGQPEYINGDNYKALANKTLTGGKLYSTDSSYTVDSTKVVLDNNTVFFIKDTNGYNVVVGLNKLPSKGITVDGNVSVIYDKSGSTNVVTAMYLAVDGAYAS